MAQRAARFRDVFAVAEFRALWIAQAQSRIGDQLARVALALLVFDQTSSAALTALVYALTLLPPLLTAPLLAGLADRYSRRTVMVSIELSRAALIGLMAIPALPLPVVALLLVAATCPQPLFAAARNATLPTVLPGDRFPVGIGIVASTDGLAQVIGFTAGGAIVAFFGSPHLALAIDAVTFVLSAALLRWGIRPHRPDPAPSATVPAGGRGGFGLAGIRLVTGDRQLLGLASLIWLYGFFLAPEALAAPYAHQIGAGVAAVGVLMAADVVGAVIGAVVVTRIRPELRKRLTVPLAVATGVPLLATVAGPAVPATVVLWAASGLLASYLILAQVTFTQQVPDAVRARAIGFASAGLQTAQGLGVLVAGGLAELMPPSVAIAVCAAAGSVGAVVINRACRLRVARPEAAITPPAAG
jgi:MFS family permease